MTLKKSILKTHILALLAITSSLFIASTMNADAQGRKRNKVVTIPPNVEISYKNGLKFLARIQKADGTFSEDARSGRGYSSQPGITGICVLAFLAHGEDPEFGPYAKVIKKGINSILKQQKSTGYIGSSMYNHGFATLALAEAYGMIEDDRLAGAIKKSVALLIKSQESNSKGGWRYTPEDNSADSTVAGCQLVALLAARNAGIPVPDKNIDLAVKYMESCRASNGGYGYTSKSNPRTTLTAIGSLCMSLAKKKNGKGFKASTKFLEKRIEDNGEYLFYHQYYMAQALFHADEEIWKRWNDRNSAIMTSAQAGNGSWNDNRLGSSGATGFALLSMALNYRFLPIYEK